MVSGYTYATTMDAALDRISAMSKDRNDALDMIAAFLRRHPQYDTDQHLTAARVALQ